MPPRRWGFLGFVYISIFLLFLTLAFFFLGSNRRQWLLLTMPVNLSFFCTVIHTVFPFLFNFSWLDLLLSSLKGEEREVQKNYWMEHSADLTVEAMMLDSQASDLDKEERPEVMLLTSRPSLVLASFFFLFDMFEFIIWFGHRCCRFVWFKICLLGIIDRIAECSILFSIFSISSIVLNSSSYEAGWFGSFVKS